ncbi:MAG: hypothetical protein QXE05_04615 [Nitrososphaeria archaeon]
MGYISSKRNKKKGGEEMGGTFSYAEVIRDRKARNLVFVVEIT